MRRVTLANLAIVIGAGLITSLTTPSVAHIEGHKLDETQCSTAWSMASPDGKPISEQQAAPYVVDFFIVDSSYGDGDSLISAEEFKIACSDGLMQSFESISKKTSLSAPSRGDVAQSPNSIILTTDSIRETAAGYVDVIVSGFPPGRFEVKCAVHDKAGRFLGVGTSRGESGPAASVFVNVADPKGAVGAKCTGQREFVGASAAHDARIVDDKQAEQIVSKIIRDYLIRNPEILVEMTTELDKRQQAQQREQQQKLISENADAIFRSPLSHVAGNPEGDVTVVEFFDYNCGFCKKVVPELVKLINNDGKVRIVLKELPIFGEDSEAAAKAALAAAKQGKYFEMYQKLFSEPGKSNREKALRIAQELGLDVPQLERDMQDSAIQRSLDEAKQLAHTLGLQGTPYFLIGDLSLPGAPDDLYDQLVRSVNQVRKEGCKFNC